MYRSVFQPLTKENVEQIVKMQLKGAFDLDEGVSELIADYANNGRDAVNILQTAGCIATIENRKDITIKDIEWVIECGQYSKRLDKRHLQKNNRLC